MSNPDFEARIAALRGKFLAMAMEERGRLQQALRALNRVEERGTALAEIRSIAHTISGTAGQFGFDDVGAIAEKLETLVDADPSNIASIRDMSASLSGALAGITR